MTNDIEEFYLSNGDLSGQLDPSFQFTLAERYRMLDRDCVYSHTIQLPDGTVLPGAVDLRGTEDAHLGGIAIEGKRVLEFGAGSGWLTSFLAARAGEVVTLDMAMGREAFAEPFAGVSHPNGLDGLRVLHEQVRRGWWMVKAHTGHAAKVVYCDLQHPPNDLGKFDVSILSSLLLHLPLPFAALQAAALHTTEAIIVTEPIFPGLQENESDTRPMAVFAPNLGTDKPNHWWHHSAAAIVRMLMVVGFTDIGMTVNMPPNMAIPLLTVTGRKPS